MISTNLGWKSCPRPNTRVSLPADKSCLSLAPMAHLRLPQLIVGMIPDYLAEPEWENKIRADRVSKGFESVGYSWFPIHRPRRLRNFELFSAAAANRRFG